MRDYTHLICHLALFGTKVSELCVSTTEERPQRVQRLLGPGSLVRFLGLEQDFALGVLI